MNPAFETTGVRRVVALDDGYASYDQEEALLAAVGARFELHPCRGDPALAVDAVREAAVVLVRETPVPRSLIEGMTRCKAIIRYGIGVDNIDQAAAAAQGIMVANVPDYGIDEVSAQAVALALGVARRLIPHDRSVREGRWPGVIDRMWRFRGRTLGFVGYGRIARMTHEKLQGFGFGRVMAHDPMAHLPDGVSPASVDDIFRQADLISLHAPLTNETHHLVNARRLALMRPSAILVNTARGGLVDLDALHQALVQGKLMGAGLDVYETEPPDASHPIFGLDNVIVTNHIGWYSEESMRELQRKAAEEALRVLRGEPARHWLNRW